MNFYTLLTGAFSPKVVAVTEGRGFVAHCKEKRNITKKKNRYESVTNERTNGKVMTNRVKMVFTSRN